MPNSRALYHEMALEGTIDYAVFERAIAGTTGWAVTTRTSLR